jgi:DNA-binding SARP family transcriptional activator/tetratricopeptide (TPR) repeat protein
MRFRILGPLLVRDGDTWLNVRAAQRRTVLAVLLIKAGSTVSVDQLIDELWGEKPPVRATATVQVYVGRLRQLLGGELASRLVTRGSGYELIVHDGDVDAHIFERLVANARAAKAHGQLATAVELYREAVALWQGPALADVPASPTVAMCAAWLDEVRIGVLEERMEAELDIGRHAEVVDELRHLAHEHPLRERLQVHHLLALQRCGRRTEALAAYQHVRRTMVNELGLEPGPELRGVQRAILAEDEQGPAGPPAGAVFAAPLAPAQLPAVAGGFVGRKRQLKQLDALLDCAGSALPVLSTIAGAAGVGKTTLTVQWAHLVRDRFPDGQLYVNLRGYTDTPPLRPIDALAGFLRALGVPGEQIPADVDQAAAVYRTILAGKRVLLLLDNANHPDQVRPLLPAGPGSMVLVTSRDQMNGLVARDGAIRIDLEMLSAAESYELLSRLVGADRVAAEPEATARLAELCGQLPLALRIAAANLCASRHATVRSYAQRLEREGSAALEVAGNRDGGVQTAFDHSYSSLESAARSLFRLCGLIPGPDLTAPAAAALADVTPQEAAQALALLTYAHLVGEPAEGRYRLHDLLRRYAAERAMAELSETDRLAALRRLFAHYLCGVEAAAAHLYPQILTLPAACGTGDGPLFDDHTAALGWLDAERPNLVAAVTRAAALGLPAAAWQIADALRGYMMNHRYLQDWFEVAQAGLAAAEAGGDPRGRAAAHLSLAGLHWVTSRPDPAVEHFAAALTLTRSNGWAEGEAVALGNLGLVYWTAGKLDEAAAKFTAALAVNERIGRVAGRATDLTNLGLVHGAQGRLALAAQRLDEALECFRQAGSRAGEAYLLANLGETYHWLGRFDEARDLLERALVIDRELGERRAEAEVQRFLAKLQRDAGEPADALKHAGIALAMMRESGDGRGEAESLVVEASIYVQAGTADQSLTRNDLALDLARRGGYRFTEAEALIGLAGAWIVAGEPERATKAADDALAIADSAGYRLLAGQAFTALAVADLQRGEYERALRRAGRAIRIQTGCGHRLGQAHAHLVAARASGAAGRERDQRAHQDRAAQIFAETGARPLPALPCRLADNNVEEKGKQACVITQ